MTDDQAMSTVNRVSGRGQPTRFRNAAAADCGDGDGQQRHSARRSLAAPPRPRTRILDAAEALFMEHGFEATSLRLDHRRRRRQPRGGQLPLRQQGRAVPGGADAAARPDEPGAGRAARRASSARPRRRALAVRAHPVGAVHPGARLARDPERGGANFLRLLGRAYADPAPFIRQFLSEQYATMIARFKDAFGRALPHLPRKELSWRLHFIMGALSYTLAGTDALKLIAELNPSRPDNDEVLLRRLAPFLLAGLHGAAARPVRDVRSREFANGAAAVRRHPPQSRRSPPMLTALWLVAVLLGALALAYVNASGRAWGVGSPRRSPRPGRARAAALARAAADRVRSSCSRSRCCPAAAPQARSATRVLARVPQGDAADVADRARGARGRHRLVGRRALLRPPGLAAAARHAARRRSPPRSSASSTTTCEELCAMASDWETTQRLPGPAAARLAVHQGQGLPRHDHPEGVRRPRLLRLRAFAGDARSCRRAPAPPR